MNLDKYQQLTGITVSSANTAQVNAQIRRTRTMLEDILGYSLSSQGNITNLYNEEGKTNVDCSCPNVDIETLLPPDEVVYAYRVYDYNQSDKYQFIDPFNTLNAVKLVYNDITIKTFNNSEMRIDYGRFGIAKYIERTLKCGIFTLSCDCDWQDVQLAVDANWLWEDCLPEDLLYVWADMVSYYADCKQDVMTEAIGRAAHSYTKFPTQQIPEQLPRNTNILKRYAGPYGSMTRNITVNTSLGLGKFR